jgi:hypothetical protein
MQKCFNNMIDHNVLPAIRCNAQGGHGIHFLSVLWGYQPLLWLVVNTVLHLENWGKGGKFMGCWQGTSFLTLNT